MKEIVLLENTAKAMSFAFVPVGDEALDAYLDGYWENESELARIGALKTFTILVIEDEDFDYEIFDHDSFRITTPTVILK